jgi:hypothetical protein
MHPIVLLAALAASILTSAPGSQPIVPLAIDYFNSAAQSRDAKICEIVAALANAGPPQRVTISAFAEYDKGEGAIVVGFVVGAEHQLSSGDLEDLNVTSAALISDSFSSADEFDYEVTEGGDGLFLARTSNEEVARRFLRSVANGGYYLVLSDDDPETPGWIYKVRSAPSAGVQQRFANCLENLGPGAMSLRGRL